METVRPFQHLYDRCREFDKDLSSYDLNIINAAYPELVKAWFDHFKKKREEEYQQSTLLKQEPLETIGEDKQRSTKYFIPSIEDIRVGYECEKGILDYSSTGSAPLGWEPYVFKNPNLRDGDFHEFSVMMNMPLRVPYLTKEQIEKEGWMYSPDTFLIETLKREPTHYWFIKNGFGCTFYPDIMRIHIEDNRQHMMSQPTLFDGECKDINTFRYICKLLKIN